MTKLDIAVAIVAPWTPIKYTKAIFKTTFTSDPYIADIAIAFYFFWADKIGPKKPDAQFKTLLIN